MGVFFAIILPLTRRYLSYKYIYFVLLFMLQECVVSSRTGGWPCGPGGLSRGHSHGHSRRRRHRRHRGDMARPDLLYIKYILRLVHTGRWCTRVDCIILSSRTGKIDFLRARTSFGSSRFSSQVRTPPGLIFKTQIDGGDPRSCSTREHPRSSIIWLPRWYSRL